MAESIPAIGIIRLDETVVNRIAAGEVIQRPSNALKEMIENSLDAKSSNIQVTIRDGGLKLMQIQDNGSGIRHSDMEIVCERFTTSKLRKFEDLSSVATYGFRGEALASISHVAHVTIVTRTAEAKCAYRGSYCDGKLKEPAKPCAGNVGTQITVEDLYYNVPTRRKALKSAAEEHQKIVEVVSRYSIHNANVGFMLKKQGESNWDVKTPAGSKPVDNIRIIYGPVVARELLEVSAKDTKLCFEFSGLVSNANYNVKRPVFLLFINNRLVDSPALRKAIELVYATYLPKNTHPFIYLSLTIMPQNIDVNVHPTKHEVHFLYEEAIFEQIQRAIDSQLLGSHVSRTFYMKTLLPSGANNGDDLLVPESSSKQKGTNNSGKLYAHQVVRTDSRAQKLDAFFMPSNKSKNDISSAASSVMSDSALDDVIMCIDENEESNANQKVPRELRTDDSQNEPITENSPAEASARSSQTSAETESKNPTITSRREIKLTSVRQLQDDIQSNIQDSVRSAFQNHTFVGIVTPEFALLQHETKLYLANTTKISREIFYQLILFNFGNFGFMRLSEPASIHELVVLALDSPASGWKSEDGPKDELANFVVELLKSKTEMLTDYFSIEIDENGNLLSLPLLLDKYVPFIAGLPMYVLRLATEVEWDNEKECFETFAQETAEFFAFKEKWVHVKDEDEDSEESFECKDPSSWKWTIEHVIYPSARLSLIPPKRFAEDGTLLQIADVTELYKVFERC